ncbi:MAG: DUF1559 domain-containing protein [Planctomycetaceae bacterium]|nr:DUF1559 domain-containing protein [Planctomycetaceae bacterium]
MKSARKGRQGFTVTELLVVIVVMGILIALLLPAVRRARESARKTQCRNNLKNLALAVHEFSEAYTHFPPSSDVWGRMKESNRVEIDRATSWGTAIFNYIDAGPGLPKDLFLEAPFSKVNAEIVGREVATFHCPSVPETRLPNIFRMPKGTVLYPPFSTAEEYSTKYGASDYIVHCGVAKGFREAAFRGHPEPKKFEGALGPIKFTPDEALADAMKRELGEVPPSGDSSFKDVTDGDANTLLISECAGRNELWRKGKKISERQDPVAFAKQKMMGGGGWADPLNQAWINGRQMDGTGANGPCAFNCSNEPDAGLYSFHRKGAHAALVDGSVRF